MQKAGEKLENTVDDLRAEQAAAIRSIENRVDRTDGMLNLKATQSDMVHMLGSKADRDVLDKLAQERQKFLREVTEQMYSVENLVSTKPDREELEGLALESAVHELVKKTAADLTTFVKSSVYEATSSKAEIADCRFLEKRITEVTGELVELTNDERIKVDARLEALRGQVQKKADISRLTKMSATINAIAHKTLEDQNPDSAGMFFRCLSCDTKLPKLKGDHAMQCLDGLLPQQNAAPAVNQFESNMQDEMRKLLTDAASKAVAASPIQQPLLDLPFGSTGRRLLLTGSDGRLYKGAFIED